MRLSSFDLKLIFFSVYKTRTIENHRKIIESMQKICKKLISSIFLNLLLININKKLFCQVYYVKYFMKTIGNKDYFVRSSSFLTSKNTEK